VILRKINQSMERCVMVYNYHPSTYFYNTGEYPIYLTILQIQKRYLNLIVLYLIIKK